MDTYDALADPVRRDVLIALAGGALAAGQIADRFDISRPAISRHLRVLRETGLVRDEVVGRRRVYRLTPGPLTEVTRLIETLTGNERADRWDRRLDALETEVHRATRDRLAGTATSAPSTTTDDPATRRAPHHPHEEIA